MARDLTYLRKTARFLARGDSSDTTFSDDDVDRLINEANGLALAIILGSGEEADLYQSGEEDTENILDATNGYTLDTDMLRVARVDIKYPDSADYQRAKYISKDRPNRLGFDKYTSTRPQYTWFNGQMIIFVGDQEANIRAVTSGIKIYNYKEITELSAVTDEPKIVQIFREYLCYYAAYTYCIGNELFKKASVLKREMTEREEKMEEFYSRFIQKNRGIRPRKEDYGQSDAIRGAEDRSVNFN